MVEIIRKIVWYFRIRLPAHIRVWRNSGKELQRRVKVEQYLYNCAGGKNPLPDEDKCRELANQLGIGKDG